MTFRKTATVREQILELLRAGPRPARILDQQIDAQPGVVSNVLQLLRRESLVVLGERRLWCLTEAGERIFIERRQQVRLLRLRLDVERLDTLARELDALRAPWFEAVTLRGIVLQALSEGPKERREIERRTQAAGYAPGGASVVLHHLRKDGRAEIVDRGGRWRAGVWALTVGAA